MDQLFLYVATGKEYLAECIKSVASLAEVDKSAPAILYTDEATLQNRLPLNGFKNIEILKNPSNDFRDKIYAMQDCSAQKIIFLDTDTTPLQKMELWPVLDRFELAFAYDPIRWDYELPEIPEAFPTPNTGVLAYRKTKEVENILKHWLTIYERQLLQESKPLHDQPAFRKAVYESQARFLVLPEEFNLRVSFAHMVPGNTKIKILHGRHEHLAKALKYSKKVNFYPRAYGGIFTKWELFEMLLNKILAKIGYVKKYKRTGLAHKE
jgi:hypothetical protein